MGSSSTRAQCWYPNKCGPRHFPQVGGMLREGQSCMRVSIAGIGIASSWLLRGRREQVLLLGKVNNRQAMSGDTESPDLVLKTSLRTLTLYVLRIGGLSLRRHSSAGWCAHTLDVGQSHWWLNYVDGMMVERTSSELNARRSSAKLSLAKQGWIIESADCLAYKYKIYFVAVCQPLCHRLRPPLADICRDAIFTAYIQWRR